jgi:hypothetical protein
MQGGYKVFNPNYNFDLETIPSLHLYKIENGSFVFLRVVKGAETGQDEFASQTESIMEYLDESVKPDFKNIFFVTLIISGNSIGALDKYSITTEEFNSQEIYPIYWVIDTETKKLISEKNQPSRLFDLDKLITGSFEYKSILGAAAPNTSAFQSLVNEYSPNQEKKLEPSVTYVLIALNVLYFALMELNGGTVLNSNLLKFGAFSTPLVTSGEYFRVLASCFIHIGYTHLIYNMMALYIFGNICEKQLGHALYLLV